MAHVCTTALNGSEKIHVKAKKLQAMGIHLGGVSQQIPSNDLELRLLIGAIKHLQASNRINPEFQNFAVNVTNDQLNGPNFGRRSLGELDGQIADRIEAENNSLTRSQDKYFHYSAKINSFVDIFQNEKLVVKVKLDFMIN